MTTKTYWNWSSYMVKGKVKVIGVSSGDLVLAAFDRENPDVVILDIMLPGQDGLTLCRNLT